MCSFLRRSRHPSLTSIRCRRDKAGGSDKEGKTDSEEEHSTLIFFIPLGGVISGADNAHGAEESCVDMGSHRASIVYGGRATMQREERSAAA